MYLDDKECWHPRCLSIQYFDLHHGQSLNPSTLHPKKINAKEIINPLICFSLQLQYIVSITTGLCSSLIKIYYFIFLARINIFSPPTIFDIIIRPKMHCLNFQSVHVHAKLMYNLTTYGKKCKSSFNIPKANESRYPSLFLTGNLSTLYLLVPSTCPDIHAYLHVRVHVITHLQNTRAILEELFHMFVICIAPVTRSVVEHQWI